MASFGLACQQGEASLSSEEIDSSTPWVAASEGNLPLLQKSLAALNLDVSVADTYGYTLLHAASSYSQIPVIEWLLSQGANVNVVDLEGDTPLHQVEDIRTAKILIEKGRANPTMLNAKGKTPLQVKQDDLEELMEDQDDDNDNDDAAKLRELIAYLSNVGIDQWR